MEDIYRGKKITVMGLGLHSGGLEAARYLARAGAELTVTDLRSRDILAPSIEKLEACGKKIRYVLGRHEMDDFLHADMVIKNPGVRADSPYLAAARRIETDISLFLQDAPPVRISAVTGSKGKSSTASALHAVLKAAERRVFLGGNITVSPLRFIGDLRPGDDLALELSSWQLGDLDLCRKNSRALLFKPRVAVITKIMPDHLDRYKDMEAYVADKRIIYRNQDSGDATISIDDSWGRRFFAESRGRPLRYSQNPLDAETSGAWFLENGAGAARPWADRTRILELLPPQTKIPGRLKQNLLLAGLAALELGVDPAIIRESLGAFPGIEHRLEYFYEVNGVRFYNDSAATIPEAAAAAVEALEHPVLVCGGTDKNLDLSPLALAAKQAAALILLAGSGSDKLIPLLEAEGVPFDGPYDELDKAVQAALAAAKAGDSIVLSPGCTSFGMFANEFDRGLKWKRSVLAACKAPDGGSSGY
jgi:UDP-N-acetylmuramoylalanine--D-glutamate ligase